MVKFILILFVQFNISLKIDFGQVAETNRKFKKKREKKRGNILNKCLLVNDSEHLIKAFYNLTIIFFYHFPLSLYTHLPRKLDRRPLVRETLVAN